MALTQQDLPGLDCGLCGFRSCGSMAERLATDPDLLERCLPRATGCLRADRGTPPFEPVRAPASTEVWVSLAPARDRAAAPISLGEEPSCGAWHDTLGREFDFYLEHFPEDPGPREIILPHNPLLTRELDIQVGDVLIGRPLGMSCGCPITHSGVTMQVDHRTGVIVWCVTGPLRPRLCMLQWRHSGLVNFLNRTPAGLSVRVEGLWIG